MEYYTTAKKKLIYKYRMSFKFRSYIQDAASHVFLNGVDRSTDMLGMCRDYLWKDK